MTPEGPSRSRVADVEVLVEAEPVPSAEPAEVVSWVAEHGRSMYRIALSVVQDAALAEDVVQEALVKAWVRRSTYRGEAPIRHWLLRITRNTAISALRRDRDEAWDPADLPEAAGWDDVERQVEARSELERLKVALAELDELSRSIIVLRELDGLSYQDVADALGISLALVKIRLFRARQRLSAAVMGESES